MLIDTDLADALIVLRREIHGWPELSNDEHETSRRVRARFEANGIEAIRPVLGTGLLVDVTGSAGADVRCIAVRADLDALPIQEETGLEFASRNVGVMHACGHDSHVAMVYAAAVSLARRRDRFAGTVRFIFQPAEEAEPLGGRAMVEEGHIDDVDAVIGIHVDPSIEAGKIGVRAGPFAASADEIDITVHGKAGHGGRPHEGVDAIAIAAGIVQELQKIPARQKDPAVPLVISIGRISGGTVRNIIAGEVVMEGTIRTMDESVRAFAHERIEAIATALARAHGGGAEVVIRRGEPVLENDPAMVALVKAAGDDVGGEGTVLDVAPWTAADDFAFYTKVKPCVYFRLGVGNAAKGCVHGLHHPAFRIDEDALPLGAAVLAHAAERFLNDPGGG